MAGWRPLRYTPMPRHPSRPGNGVEQGGGRCQAGGGVFTLVIGYRTGRFIKGKLTKTGLPITYGFIPLFLALTGE